LLEVDRVKVDRVKPVDCRLGSHACVAGNAFHAEDHLQISSANSFRLMEQLVKQQALSSEL